MCSISKARFAPLIEMNKAFKIYEGITSEAALPQMHWEPESKLSHSLDQQARDLKCWLLI